MYTPPANGQYNHGDGYRHMHQETLHAAPERTDTQTDKHHKYSKNHLMQERGALANRSGYSAAGILPKLTGLGPKGQQGASG